MAEGVGQQTRDCRLSSLHDFICKMKVRRTEIQSPAHGEHSCLSIPVTRVCHSRWLCTEGRGYKGLWATSSAITSVLTRMEKAGPLQSPAGTMDSDILDPDLTVTYTYFNMTLYQFYNFKNVDKNTLGLSAKPTVSMIIYVISRINYNSL